MFTIDYTNISEIEVDIMFDQNLFNKVKFHLDQAKRIKRQFLCVVSGE